jgi:hypothetical protein
VDSAAFDALTRAVTTRRVTLGGVVASAMSLLAIAPAAAVDGRASRCNQIKNPERQRRCQQRARKPGRKCKSRACKSRPVEVTCAGRCGTAIDNCGKGVRCPKCPPLKSCLNNGSCAVVVGQFGPGCPGGCGASKPSTEGGANCVALGQTCDTATLTCIDTTDCPVGFHCQQVDCGSSPNTKRCIALCPI